MAQRAKIRKKKIKPVRLVIRILGIAFAVIVIGFVGFQIYRALDSTITTEPAREYTMFASVNVDGFAVRDEQVLTGSPSGVLTYEIGDAQNVRNNGIIAYVYPDSQSIRIKKKIEDIDTEIAQLETVEKSNGSNPDLIDKQVDEKFGKYLDTIENGDITNIEDIGSQLLNLFNKRQVLTNKENISVITSRISRLKNEKEELEKQLKASPESISAPAAGYFSSVIDNCEEIVDYTSVQKMTIDEFSLLPESVNKTSGGSTIGRIVKQYVWYYVFEIPQESLSRFKKNMEVNVVFDALPNRTVPMKLVAINSPLGNSNAKGSVGVLRCTVLDKDLISLRRESAQIQINKYSGLRVSNEAIRFNENNEMGVYVLEGNLIQFKLINPVYVEETFVISSKPESTDDDVLEDAQQKDTDDDTVDDINEEDEQKNGYSYLSQYDEIIIKGKDLSHGKVISSF